MKPPERSSHQVNKFRDRAREVIKHHLGEAKRITYLSSGRTNFVFSFKSGDEDLIIRISPDPSSINAFIKEQWAVRAARKAGVPAPEILEVGLEFIDQPYMITRAALGDDAKAHPDRLKIIREMGRLGAIINSIETKGFGETFDWSDNRLSLNTTLKDWLEKEFDYEKKVETLEKHRMLAGERGKQIRKIFAQHARSRSLAVLNHSDLRLKNVIVGDDGKINAILDWEGCISTQAPAWELSLALHDLGIDEVQQFLEGYGITKKQLTDAMPLIRAFNITNYATVVADAAKSNDKKVLEHLRLRLSGGLDLYSL